jgi:hypothetical protein
VLGLAERFGQPPHDVLTWDASVLRLLRIEALGREDEHGRQ